MEDEAKKLKDKESNIKKEINRLKKLFEKVPAKTLDKVKSLIENAAFMTVTLDDLQDAINRKGVVEEYQNGANQKGFKKTCEVEVYNTMVKNQIAIFKQLNEIMPSNSKPENSTDDEFLKLVKRKTT